MADVRLNGPQPSLVQPSGPASRRSWSWRR